MMKLSLLFAASYVFQSVQAEDVFMTLNFESKLLFPDGFAKNSTTVNGEFPGPTIRTMKGDKAHITVINNLSNNEVLSIHWHGISQKGTPWADGSSSINSCPFDNGKSHTYVFDTMNSGTFWYHPHSYNPGSGRSDGGYGFLLVGEDEAEKAKFVYDEERTIILSDWYHLSEITIGQGLSRYGTGYKFPGKGNAILFNGVGMCTGTETGCNNVTRKVSIDVKPNKTYRLRILNAGALSYYNMAISDHNMTIIKAGMTPTKQIQLHSLDINCAARFDVLITTSAAVASYHIQVETNWRGSDVDAAGLNNVNFFLRYDMSSVIAPLNVKNESKAWNQQSSEIVMPVSASTVVTVAEPTKRFTFDVAQQYTNKDTNYGLDLNGTNKEGYLRWTLNQLSYRATLTSKLLASYYDMQFPMAINATKSIKIDLNDEVRIVFQNHAALNGVCEQHPWHLHGYDFKILGQGVGLYNVSSDKLNLVNPFLSSDVTGFPTSNGQQRNQGFVKAVPHTPCGWVVIQFKADNPGVWWLHCHISWHLILGMTVIFDVASKSLWDSVEKLAKLPDSFKYEFCGDITKDSLVPDRFPAMSTVVPTAVPTTLPSMG